MKKFLRLKSQAIAICLIVLIMIFFHVLSPNFRIFLKRSSGDPFRERQNYLNPELTGAQKFVLGIPIDINKAIPDDLTILPGIGPKTAVGIVAERGKGGHFISTEGLLRVKGIGPKKLSKLRRFICVEDVRREEGGN